MILSNEEIKTRMKKGSIKIEPFFPERLGSNSYDLTLSKHVAEYTSFPLDARKENPLTRYEIQEEGLLLLPEKLYLMSCNEYTETLDCVPFIEGKSSVGRLGINIHVTAGKGDVGFCGHWTLEVSVVAPVKVYRNMPIAQIIYFEMLGNCTKPYGNKPDAKYNNQSILPQGSKMFLNEF